MGRAGDGIVRLGLRYADGLREEDRSSDCRTSTAMPTPAAGFDRSTNSSRTPASAATSCNTLAGIGALNAFGYNRRSALWQVERAIRPAGEMFAASP